jgi:hypothetical protein
MKAVEVWSEKITDRDLVEQRLVIILAEGVAQSNSFRLLFFVLLFSALMTFAFDLMAYSSLWLLVTEYLSMMPLMEILLRF